MNGIFAYLAIAFGVAWGIWGTLWMNGISGTDPLFQWMSLPAAFAPALGSFVVRRWIIAEGFADINHGGAGRAIGLGLYLLYLHRFLNVRKDTP